MAKLICTGIASLDGYIADERGGFDWSAPDAEVHAFVNDRDRSVGTYLLGRRMYEVLRVWDDLADDPSISEVERDFAAVWLDADKIVYSATLDEVSTARTRLERRFDAAAVERLRAEADRDLSIAGPTLAAQAIKAGLVDEFQLYVNPVIVGGGTSFLPDGVRLDLELLEEHRFGNGVVFVRYRNVTR
ncbi:dihydrofolate reductase family protein [Agromyces ramosus]|uniref:Dihydrofolate reductase n=1 Tax=Agromyces ramosus TaxID=33879 RepID=A0ABU0R7D9_9MICO|nr:dihydrofolate reductase family protein [Agromyces ramosus]MDQ0894003.1 dihydrofolate reductase [Agromyces ramosus]